MTVLTAARPGGTFVPGQTYEYELTASWAAHAADPLGGPVAAGRHAPDVPRSAGRGRRPRRRHTSCRKPHGGGRDGLALADGRASTPASPPTPPPQPHLLVHVGRPDLRRRGRPPADARGSCGSRRTCRHRRDRRVRGAAADRRTRSRHERARLHRARLANHLWTFGEFIAMYLLDVVAGAVAGGAAAVPDDPPSPRRRSRCQRESLEQRSRSTSSCTRRRCRKVRQVLANVPSLMIFDDHEITDDWNIDYAWVNTVYEQARPAAGRSPTGCSPTCCASTGATGRRRSRPRDPPEQRALDGGRGRRRHRRQPERGGDVRAAARRSDRTAADGAAGAVAARPVGGRRDPVRPGARPRRRLAGADRAAGRAHRPRVPADRPPRRPHLPRGARRCNFRPPPTPVPFDARRRGRADPRQRARRERASSRCSSCCCPSGRALRRLRVVVGGDRQPPGPARPPRRPPPGGAALGRRPLRVHVEADPHRGRRRRRASAQLTASAAKNLEAKNTAIGMFSELDHAARPRARPARPPGTRSCRPPTGPSCSSPPPAGTVLAWDDAVDVLLGRVARGRPRRRRRSPTPVAAAYGLAAPGWTYTIDPVDDPMHDYAAPPVDPPWHGWHPDKSLKMADALQAADLERISRGCSSGCRTSAVVTFTAVRHLADGGTRSCAARSAPSSHRRASPVHGTWCGRTWCCREQREPSRCSTWSRRPTVDAIEAPAACSPSADPGRRWAGRAPIPFGSSRPSPTCSPTPCARWRCRSHDDFCSALRAWGEDLVDLAEVVLSPVAAARRRRRTAGGGPDRSSVLRSKFPRLASLLSRRRRDRRQPAASARASTGRSCATSCSNGAELVDEDFWDELPARPTWRAAGCRPCSRDPADRGAGDARGAAHGRPPARRRSSRRRCRPTPPAWKDLRARTAPAGSRSPLPLQRRPTASACRTAPDLARRLRPRAGDRACCSARSGAPPAGRTVTDFEIWVHPSSDDADRFELRSPVRLHRPGRAERARSGSATTASAGTWNAAIAPRTPSPVAASTNEAVISTRQATPPATAGPAPRAALRHAPRRARPRARPAAARAGRAQRRGGRPDRRLRPRAHQPLVPLARRERSRSREGLRLDLDLDARLRRGHRASASPPRARSRRALARPARRSLKERADPVHSILLSVPIRADAGPLRHPRRGPLRTGRRTLGPVTLVMDGAGGWVGWWADAPGGPKECIGLLAADRRRPAARLPRRHRRRLPRLHRRRPNDRYGGVRHPDHRAAQGLSRASRSPRSASTS